MAGEAKFPTFARIDAVSNLSMGNGDEQNRLFAEAEKAGIHIKRPHFYSPVPTVSELDKSAFDESSDAGIRWDDEGALDLLGKLSEFASEFKQAIKSGK